MNFCSNKIFNEKTEFYAGIKSKEGYFLCYPCYLFCRQNKDCSCDSIYDDLSCPVYPLKNESGCFCTRDLNTKCKFDCLPNYFQNEENINNSLIEMKNLFEEEKEKFKNKRNEAKFKKYWSRDFDFERS